MNQDHAELPSLTGDSNMICISTSHNPEFWALQYSMEKACKNLNMRNQFCIQQGTSHEEHAGSSINILRVASFYQGI